MSATSAPRPRLREVLREPRMVAVLGLGLASGLPYNLTDSTLQAWLKDFGVSNTQIGLLTLVGLPYAWKFLWAPFIDRYRLPFLGRRRGWIFVLQLALAAVIAASAFYSPGNALAVVATLAFVTGLLSATQDIVINAYTADIALPHERGLAAMSTSVGYRAAAWFSFSIALIVAQYAGWKAAYLLLAATMVALAVGTLFAPEPAQRAAPPDTLRVSIVEPLRQLLTGPGALALIVLLVVYKVGDAFSLRLFTPFLMDLGFSKAEIGVVTKTTMAVATIGGTVLGGVWMIRLGLYRALLWFGAFQAVSNLTYMLLAVAGKQHLLMIFAIAIDNFAGGMGSVALTAFVLALCDQRFSAFQYALLSAIAVIPRTYLGVPAGFLADRAGWPTFYLVSFIAAIPGIVLVWWLRRDVRALDARGTPGAPPAAA
ncbi:MAG: MFS transporter [Steroidobacteraceae bacterium]|nr:MFS transporter [Steroidobacteraceae bacterium]MCW5572745.1 MFS transporter [Steroidobacteraceae bacterium]